MCVVHKICLINTEIDSCSSNPCFNGGTCYSDFGFFSCGCPYGITGMYCQTG